MPDRTLYLPATPERAYLIVRDRAVPGPEPEVVLLARRGACPGGTAVGVRLLEAQLRDAGAGRYLADRALVAGDRITRAFQPWHADVETDSRARWKGYLQDESITLRNLVGADTPMTLRTKEDDRVEARMLELAARPVTPTFDLAHLRELHRRLFQDVYPWAGETRTVNMSRGTGSGPGFITWEGIDTAWDTIEETLEDLGHLVDVDQERFANEAARIYNMVNTTHAFREGNGRTQREWMNDLARRAGYHLDWQQVAGVVNDRASQAGREDDLEPLQQMFQAITTAGPDPVRTPPADSRHLRAVQASFPAPATGATKSPPSRRKDRGLARYGAAGYDQPARSNERGE